MSVEISNGAKRHYAMHERASSDARALAAAVRRAELAEARLERSEARLADVSERIGRLEARMDRARQKRVSSKPLSNGDLCYGVQAIADHVGVTDDRQADLLYGMPAIAEFLGLKVPQARHLSDKGAIPTFKLPGNKNTCARRSTLTAWLAEREGATNG